MSYWTDYAIPADLLPADIPSGVTVELAVSPEDTPIDGNASAWGDEDDAEYAEAIRRQLENGNDWAWCMVRVTVTDGDAEGRAYLGGVSYWWTDTRADGEPATPSDRAIVRAFMQDNGADMIAEALADYHADAERLAAKYAARD